MGAGALAADLTAYLVDVAAIVRNPDPHRNPKPWLPGPGAFSMVGDDDHGQLASRSWTTGVKVFDTWSLHDPGENYDPPSPRSSSLNWPPLTEQAAHDLRVRLGGRNAMVAAH